MNHNSSSRDDEGVGVAHKVWSPINQPQFPQMMMGQVKTSLNEAFRSTWNAATEFKKKFINGVFYLLSNCLISSDQHNSKMA